MALHPCFQPASSQLPIPTPLQIKKKKAAAAVDKKIRKQQQHTIGRSGNRGDRALKDTQTCVDMCQYSYNIILTCVSVPTKSGSITKERCWHVSVSLRKIVSVPAGVCWQRSVFLRKGNDSYSVSVHTKKCCQGSVFLRKGNNSYSVNVPTKRCWQVSVSLQEIIDGCQCPYGKVIKITASVSVLTKVLTGVSVFIGGC